MLFADNHVTDSTMLLKVDVGSTNARCLDVHNNLSRAGLQLVSFGLAFGDVNVVLRVGKHTNIGAEDLCSSAGHVGSCGASEV
jgi:hypothetical protein